MPFEVIPAIDVASGRLVSASSTGTVPIDAFDGDPLAAAEVFVAGGASSLHVVDVGRARGERSALDLIAALARIAPVQASGGLASRAAVLEVLDAGASRAVIGSGMLADREATAALVSELGERAVVGIEADGNVVRPRSVAAAELPLSETLSWVRTIGASRYLFTAVSRVAGLRGPDLDGLRKAAALLGSPLLAAGGIRGVGDVLAVRELGPATVEGVVVGRALYEGLDLREVLLALGDRPPASPARP